MNEKLDSDWAIAGFGLNPLNGKIENLKIVHKITKKQKLLSISEEARNRMSDGNSMNDNLQIALYAAMQEYGVNEI